MLKIITIVILMNCIFSSVSVAQIDTLNFVFCDKERYLHINHLMLGVGGKEIPIPRINNNTFVNPSKYLNSTDTGGYFILETEKCVFLLHDISRYLQIPKWELCLPIRKKYKLNRRYTFINYYNGGYGYVGVLRRIDNKIGTKPILTDQ